MTNPFKVGDLIEPLTNQSHSIEFWCGRSKTGKFEVTSTTSTNVYVRPEGTHSISTSVSASKFKPLARRVEDAEIKPEDIKVGDTIRVSKVSGKMTMIHEAVVGEIKRQTDTKNLGTLLFYTERFSSTSQRINWGKSTDEVFTLLKAAPERDLLLDRMVAAPAGQVITFREVLARKCSDDRWEAIYDGGVATLFTGNLRTQIGRCKVSWLKAES